MKPTLVIRATLRTLGPLSIKMPKPDGGRENEFANFPVMTRGVEDTGQRLQTGYLPATTLRGYLRRAIVLRAMRDKTGGPGAVDGGDASGSGRSRRQREKGDRGAKPRGAGSSPAAPLDLKASVQRAAAGKKASRNEPRGGGKSRKGRR